jgi:hypothetical protein
MLREMFAISSDIVDGRLSKHLGAASRRLRGWVGDAAYDDALLGPAALDPDRRDDLVLAEAHIAMHLAILGINTHIRSSGVVKTERIEGEITVNYLTPAEAQQVSDDYLARAEEIAGHEC